jgi:lysophospholipase L1-like esterase
VGGLVISWYVSKKRDGSMKIIIFILMVAALTSACGGGDTQTSAAPILATPIIPENIATWGDSLTAGDGGTPYQNQLALLLPNRTIHNGGGSGQGSTSIAVRQGSIPLQISVTGDVIPAIGEVNLTSTTAKTGTFNYRDPGKLFGTLSGVHGYIERIPNPDSAITALRFIRDDQAGSNTASPGNSTYTVDTLGRDSWINIFWMGNNNIPDSTTVKSDIATAVGFLKATHKKYIVMSITNNSSRIKGTADYQIIIDLNQYLATRYPDNYLDIRSYLVSQYDPTNSQDVLDFQNDLTPSSLRVDGIHLNTKGYGLIAKRISEFILAKGW